MSFAFTSYTSVILPTPTMSPNTSATPTPTASSVTPTPTPTPSITPTITPTVSITPTPTQTPDVPVIINNPSDYTYNPKPGGDGYAVFGIQYNANSIVVLSWELSSDNGNTWQTIVGSNSDTIYLYNLYAESNNYLYRCLLNNGVYSIYSNAARLSSSGGASESYVANTQITNNNTAEFRIIT